MAAQQHSPAVDCYLFFVFYPCICLFAFFFYFHFSFLRFSFFLITFFVFYVLYVLSSCFSLTLLLFTGITDYYMNICICKVVPCNFMLLQQNVKWKFVQNSSSHLLGGKPGDNTSEVFYFTVKKECLLPYWAVLNHSHTSIFTSCRFFPLYNAVFKLVS